MAMLPVSIITADNSGPGELNRDEKAACKLCFREQGKYTCPRCRVWYCSLACYKGENHADCSEDFYKETVMEDINSRPVDEEDKRKLLEMLKRLNESEDTDTDGSEEEYEDDADGDLAADLRKVNLDEMDVAKLWDMLDDEQRADFEKALADGRLGNMVNLWTPWWAPGEDAQPPPPLPANIPPLTAIAGPKHTPGRELPYNAVDLLYAYAYTLRAFNNDVDDPEDCFDAGRCCVQLSAVLSKNAVHASTALAAHSCLHNAQMRVSTGQQPLWDAVSVLADVEAMMESIAVVTLALGELHSLLTRARSAAKHLEGNVEDAQHADALKEFRKMFALYIRKAWYFVAWAAASMGTDNITCNATLERVRDQVRAQRERLEGEAAAQAAEIASVASVQAGAGVASLAVAAPSSAAATPRDELPGGQKGRVLIEEL